MNKGSPLCVLIFCKTKFQHRGDPLLFFENLNFDKLGIGGTLCIFSGIFNFDEQPRARLTCMLNFLKLTKNFEFFGLKTRDCRECVNYMNNFARAPAFLSILKICPRGRPRYQTLENRPRGPAGRAGARAQSTFDPWENPPAPARGPTPIKTSSYHSR